MAEALEGRALLAVGLDPTWGFGGVATPSFSSIALQDGQVVGLGMETVTGSAGGTGFTQLFVSRLTTGGFLDPTFGSGGTETIPMSFTGQNKYDVAAQDIAVQPDGRIDVLATVSGAFLVVQLTPDGSIDPTFGNAGGGELFGLGPAASLYPDAAAAIALGPDGKIVVVSTAVPQGTDTSVFAVARLNTNGTLDTSFAGTGYTTVPFSTSATASSVVVQPDDAIVVAGRADVPANYPRLTNVLPSDTAVARLNANGTLDTSFNGTGMLTFNEDLGGSVSDDTANAVTLSGTQIVLAGEAEEVLPAAPNPVVFTPPIYDLTVTELNADGSFDTAFSGNGRYLLQLSQGGINFNTTAASVIARPSGSLLVGGSAVEPSSVNGYAGGGLLLSLTPAGRLTRPSAPAGWR